MAQLTNSQLATSSNAMPMVVSADRTGDTDNELLSL